MIKSSYLISGVAIASTLLLPFATSAQVVTTTSPTTNRPAFTHRMPAHPFVKGTPMNKLPPKGTPHKGMRPEGFANHGVMGTVTTVNGTTINLTNASGTAYTVDASAAKFMGGFPGNTATIASIQVGDKLMVGGTVTGTSVAAKMISDASMQKRSMVVGTVKAVNGTTISLNDMSGTAYTVDASSAKFGPAFPRGAAPLTISSVKVGDKVMIGGTINGTSVTATMVHDMPAPKPGMFRGGFGGHGGHRGPMPAPAPQT